MKLTLRHLFGAFLACFVSFTLVACEGPVTEEDEGDEDNSGGGVSEGEEYPDYTPQTVSCDGGGNNWCLAKCSKTGDHLHVVGVFPGACAAAGEQYCKSHGLGYRTKACYGHL